VEVVNLLITTQETVRLVDLDLSWLSTP